MTSEPADPSSLAWRVASAMLASEGTGPHWGIVLEAAETGYARVSMRLKPEMLNGLGIAHGALVFGVGDTAFAYACNSRNVAAVAYTVSVTFLDAGKAGEKLTAEAQERAIKGRTGIYAITVKGEDGRVIAEMQGVSRALGRPVIEEDET